MLGSKKKEEAFPVNEALLNVITPMGLEIKRNSLVIGENLGKAYGAVRYPQKVDMGWLSKITNIPSTIVSVGITPIDNGSLISAISKSIVQQRGAADSAKDPLTRQRAEKAAEDGERIMQRIDQEGETVAMMSLTVMPIAQDLEGLWSNGQIAVLKKALSAAAKSGVGLLEATEVVEPNPISPNESTSYSNLYHCDRDGVYLYIDAVSGQLADAIGKNEG